MPTHRKNQLIGLDIGSHSIKLVEIDDSKKGRVLKRFGMAGLPPQAIVEGSIKEMEIISSKIKDLFKNLKVKNKNVATSISGFSVIVKKITLTNKEESELETTIQDEAEQYIPFDIDEVNIDFDILSAENAAADEEESTDETSGQMEVMLVAAKRDMVEDYSSLLQLANLNAVVLDVDAFALQNALEISEGRTEGCCALVNVGAEELGINVVKEDMSLFTRDSSFGGSQITEAIMSQFSVSFSEAEKIKLGVIKKERDEGVLENIFVSVVSEWVQEIKRALDFVASTYPDETIEKILVCGGSCRIPDFKEYLAVETGIKVAELNPFTNLVINEKAFDPKYLKYIAPQAAVAVGLALRSIGDK